MEIRTDSSKQRFIEVAMNNGEFVRITFIGESWNPERPAIRINIKEQNGRLRMGPEVPVDCVGDLVKAAILLLNDANNQNE